MERRMNLKVSGELQLVGDGIYLPEDFKGPYVTGTQFFPGQPKLDIPG